jgi:hypothetical protein
MKERYTFSPLLFLCTEIEIIGKQDIIFWLVNTLFSLQNGYWET